MSIVVRWGAGDLPDGTDRVPVLGQPAWEGAYTRLENGGAPGDVRPLFSVLGALAPFRPDGPLPVAIARFAYTVPDDPAAHVAFLACGLLHDQWGFAVPAYRGRTVPFLVREDFLLGDAEPDAVELDPGDGGGFRAVAIGTPLPVSFGAAGPVTVTVRCTYGAESLEARFTVTLSDRPAAPLPDETWPLHGESGNTGTAYVYRAHGAAEISRPIVMVEGFPGGHPADYQYDTLDQQSTATALRAAGRDLILVGLDDGMDLIQRNADVLVDLIRQTIARTSEPLVVGGVSMGGLVSRYALAAMEARGEPHGTGVFLTIDTPHAGTYTSLAAQWFVQSFLPHLPALAGSAALLDSAANQQFDLLWLHDGVASTSPLREQFVSELEKLGDYPQLPRRLAISSGRGDGARLAPPGTQIMSWAGGAAATAELRALAAGAPSTVGCGTWGETTLAPLSADAGVPWDVAPGGQESYNGQVAAIAAAVGCGPVTHALDSACTIPTVSALDLRQDPFAPVPAPGEGSSPFHDYAFSQDNEPHLTITQAVSAWLLAALEVPIHA